MFCSNSFVCGSNTILTPLRFFCWKHAKNKLFLKKTDVGVNDATNRKNVAGCFALVAITTPVVSLKNCHVQSLLGFPAEVLLNHFWLLD
jgi:hypothetical protein